MEAKAARRDDKRAREASPDVVRLPGGGDPMGGGDGDSFQAAQARWVAVLNELQSTMSQCGNGNRFQAAQARCQP